MKDENRKWFLITLVLVGIVMTWILGQFLTFLGNYLAFHVKPLIGIFPFYYSIAAIVNFLLVFFLIKRQDVALFANETVMEIKKVTWPTASDTYKSTAVVLAAVFIFAAILWIYDSILTLLLKKFL